LHNAPFFITMYRLLFLLGFLLAGLLVGCQPIARFPDPVKVGLLLPLEGERRELGYSLLPALLAATPATIQGQPIEWVILDTHSDPATAAQRARDLVTDSAVVYIVGPLLAAEAEAVRPIVTEAEIAWLPLVPAGQGDGWRSDWEAECWVAVQLEADPAPPCATVRVPADTTAYQSALGSAPSPLNWLMWDATTFMVAQLNQAETLNRSTLYQTSEAYRFPPLVE
jgi:hypothetical protein